MRRLSPFLHFAAFVSACNVYDATLLEGRNGPGPALPSDDGSVSGAGAADGGKEADSAQREASGIVDARAEVSPALDANPPNDEDSTFGPTDAAVDVPSDALREAADRSAPVDAQDAPVQTGVDGLTCTGFALSANGTNAFEVNRPVQDDFTLEAWMKTTSSLNGGNFWEGRGVFYADVPGPVNDFAATILNDRFSFGVGNPNGIETTLIGTTVVTSNLWVHVAATRQRSTGEMRVYANGNLEGLATPANTNALSAPAFLTIAGHDDAARYFMGILDEVRIWNVVRTQAEIASTMHQRLNGNEPGLVGYWRFDDVDAGTPVDSSPTNATAILRGTPLVWAPSDALCSR